MRRLLTIGIVAAMTFAASSSQAALNAYLTITGQRQGVFKGGVTQKGNEGTIAVVGFDHDITSPRDPQSGLPTGQRMHKPFTVELELDPTTPMLYQALTTNEVLTDVTLKLWQPMMSGGIATGQEQNTMNIRLTNANIADIKIEDDQGTSTGTSEVQRKPVRVTVSFTYQKIQWTWVNGGVTAGDNWSSRS